MDGRLTLIFAKFSANWDTITKILAFLKLEENEFSPNLEGLASKLLLPRSLEVLDGLAGNPNPWHLEPSNFARVGFLWRLTNFKVFCWYLLPLLRKLKIQYFSSSNGPHLWGPCKEKSYWIFNFSKVVGDINTNFSPFVNLYRILLCTKKNS